MDMASMQKKTHLIGVLGRILFEIHGPPDFEVGLTVQVGGLDEAHLHTHCSHVTLRPSHVTLHCKTVQMQDLLTEHTWMLKLIMHHQLSSACCTSRRIAPQQMNLKKSSILEHAKMPKVNT